MNVALSSFDDVAQSRKVFVGFSSFLYKYTLFSWKRKIINCRVEHQSIKLFRLYFITQVIEISEYRGQLYDYLKNRMLAIAPNLTILVGELVGARLIAHAGE